MSFIGLRDYSIATGNGLSNKIAYAAWHFAEKLKALLLRARYLLTALILLLPFSKTIDSFVFKLKILRR